jgi:hypothetical protein
MKSVRFFSIVFFLLFVSVAGFAQKKQIMVITAIEYAEFLSGGASTMFITFPDGNQQQIELKGLFSLAGFVSEKNFKRNDKVIVDKVNEYLKQDWELEAVTSAIRDGERGQSIFFTRYVLSKKAN